MILSKYCQKIKDKSGMSIGRVKKLIPTLPNKEKYVLHYRSLHLYMDLGLKVIELHRVLQFNQSLWLKHYIDLLY